MSLRRVAELLILKKTSPPSCNKSPLSTKPENSSSVSRIVSANESTGLTHVKPTPCTDSIQCTQSPILGRNVYTTAQLEVFQTEPGVAASSENCASHYREDNHMISAVILRPKKQRLLRSCHFLNSSPVVAFSITGCGWPIPNQTHEDGKPRVF